MKTKQFSIGSLFLMVVAMAITAVFITPFTHAAVTQTITVNTTADVVFNNGQCSLREAVIAANTNTPSGNLAGECLAGSDTETDVITLANGETYTLAVAGTNEDDAATGDLDVLDNTAVLDVQFVVAGNGTATIDADNIDRVIETIQATVEMTDIGLSNGAVVASNGGLLLNNNGIVNINGGSLISGQALAGGAIANYSSTQEVGKLTLNNAIITLSAANNGGGISQFGTNSVAMTLTNTLVRANATNGNGGGINALGGTVTINGGSVSLNNAGDGGGIHAVGNSTVLTINSSTIESNQSSNTGGGIYISGSGATITGGSIASNQSPFGGGIYAEINAVIALDAVLIELNQASGFGGGIYLISTGTIVNSTFTNLTFNGNTTNGNGGGIYAHSAATITVQNSDFTNNSADKGGAIAASDAEIYGGTFNANSATGFGGAIRVIYVLDVTDAVFLQNDAKIGGAIRASSLAATNIRVEQNEAELLGGGVYISDSDVAGASSISKSVFTENTAGESGGGIYIYGDLTNDASTIVQTAVTENTATGDGAGIWLENVELYLTNSTISSNSAAGNGDGLFIDTTAAITATNVTIAFNSPGEDIYKVGEMTVQNSIIFSPGGNNCFFVATPLVSLGNNLAGDGISCAGLTQPTDEINPNVSLGLLQDNGGNTLTHDLLDGSPAIDTGNAAACAASLVNNVDQRGIPRPIGTTCDKGAVERGSVVYLPVILK